MALILMISAIGLMLVWNRQRARDEQDISAETAFIAEKKQLFSEAEKTWWDRFNALPENRRACRFALLGTSPKGECDNAFQCAQCRTAKSFLPPDLTRRPICGPDQEWKGVAIPGNVFFHRGHTWARVDSDGTLLVGIDDFARRLAGTAVRFVAPLIGSTVETGEAAGLLKKGSISIPVLSPVDGRIISYNRDLVNEPGRPLRDVYGEDWLIRVKPYNLHQNLRALLNGVEARIWMQNEIRQLEEYMQPEGQLALAADGGLLVEELAPALGSRWESGVRNFLLTL